MSRLFEAIAAVGRVVPKSRWVPGPNGSASWHPAFRFSSWEPGVLEELTGRLRRLGHDRPHDQGPGELESGNLQMDFVFRCVFNVS